jgi:hypothetical protein
MPAAPLCAAAWSLAARAQQRPLPVIGLLSSRSSATDAPLIAIIRQGLNEMGFVEGRNVAIDYRWAEGQYDRLPGLAADLVRRQVVVIVTVGGDPSALAAKAARRREQDKLPDSNVSSVVSGCAECGVPYRRDENPCRQPCACPVHAPALQERKVDMNVEPLVPKGRAMTCASSRVMPSLSDGSRYAYRLTTKGLEVSLLFLFFHKRLCGPPTAASHHQPIARRRPDSRLEAAYHRADAAIQKVVDLLATA